MQVARALLTALQLTTDGISTVSDATNVILSSTLMRTSCFSVMALSFATTVHIAAALAGTKLRTWRFLPEIRPFAPLAFVAETARGRSKI
jgi:hypothetical protein